MDYEDKYGVTEISLNGVKKFKEQRLVEVFIEPGLPQNSTFYFSNRDTYKATGFAVGYGGSGPHGLYNAIRFFYPDLLNQDFWETDIPRLNPERIIGWTPEKGCHYKD